MSQSLDDSARERERAIMRAFATLLKHHHWVEGPLEGGPQTLYRTILEEGKFVGRKEKVRDLDATDPVGAVLEAAAYLASEIS